MQVIRGGAEFHAIAESLGRLHRQTMSLNEPLLELLLLAAKREAEKAANADPRTPQRSIETAIGETLADHAAAMQMIREAVEKFGPTAALESREASLLRGPTPTDEAESIVEALGRLRSRLDSSEHAQ